VIKIHKYSLEDKSRWDEFIMESRNGTFIFLRDYLEYHLDRYTDSSFLFTKNKRILAVIPGNIEDQSFYSHKGLTYGGFVCSNKVSVLEIIEFFQLLNSELKKENIKKVIYKPVPYIYHKYPTQEDVYLLHKLGANKVACNISSVIPLSTRLRFTTCRKRGIKKGNKFGIEISESDRYDLFWQMLNENLNRKYSAKPIHSLEEIVLLKDRFPGNIKLYLAYSEDIAIAGVVVYISSTTVKAQYISITQEGRRKGALDFLFNELINNLYSVIPFFDLGTSNGNNGFMLNTNLIFPKQGFGGRGVVYETYSYNL